MKIGVLSDTHDNLANLLAVLEICREQQIDTVIHCGDLTGLEMVSPFAGFRTIFTYGNMDHISGAIKKRFEKIGKDNYAGLVFTGALGGVSIAATHSHIEGKLMDLVSSQRYKWVFHGHTHLKRDEIIHGLRIVNPGALGGLGREPRSFCIANLLTEDVEFIRI
ncbi:MAG: hypothetical protein BWX85_00797 [Chloroflexi bacterium ADurb.Bin120]|nr:MAG: hypothetical protein BWX85_00797 [Chloroflexi bacterium ADurb.Bin120]